MKFIWNTLFVSLLVFFCVSCNKWRNPCDDENPPNALPFGEFFESYLMPPDKTYVTYQDSVTQDTLGRTFFWNLEEDYHNLQHQFPDRKGDGKCYRYSQKKFKGSGENGMDFYAKHDRRSFTASLNIQERKGYFGYTEEPNQSDTSFLYDSSLQIIPEMEINNHLIKDIVIFSNPDGKVFFAKNRFIVKIKIKDKVYEIY